MFTGLIAELGELIDVERSEAGARLQIVAKLAAELEEGDSVAVNGVCLTATSVAPDRFTTEAMNETLRLTSLAGIVPGRRLNLELPVQPSGHLGGHIVQGHVDGVGHVSDVRADGFARLVTIEAPPGLRRYIVHKGSVAVDGVSLTVATVTDGAFTVSLIPETLERTNLGSAMPGAIVNLEADVVAKYVERLMAR